MKRELYVAGVQFRGQEVREDINTINKGDILTLEPEPTNKYDPNAVKIKHGDVHIGYVPKIFSSEISAAIEIGLPIECVVIRIDTKAKPWESCRVIIKDTKEA